MELESRMLILDFEAKSLLSGMLPLNLLLINAAAYKFEDII